MTGAPEEGDGMAEQRKRVVEGQLQGRLRTHGAVLVTGPKAVGKTTMARRFAASEVRLDQRSCRAHGGRTDPLPRPRR